jgi:hypothetical protein
MQGIRQPSSGGVKEGFRQSLGKSRTASLSNRSSRRITGQDSLSAKLQKKADELALLKVEDDSDEEADDAEDSSADGRKNSKDAAEGGSATGDNEDDDSDIDEEQEALLESEAASKTNFSRRKAILTSSLHDRMKRIRESTKKKLRMARKAQEEDIMRAELLKLPAAERHGMRKVFDRFDLDESDTLEGTEIVEALRELGLKGTAIEEKKAISTICKEAVEERARFDNPNKSKQDYIPGVDDDDPLGEDEDEITPHIDFLTFALKVVRPEHRSYAP